MDLRERFEKAVRESIHREGIDNLMDWISRTDFYDAPASTKYHDCYTGGLVAHSLNVYFYLSKLCEWFQCDASDESIALVALFHDICKIGCYKTEVRWKKDNRNQWQSYNAYRFEEDFSYGGHGSKSVFLLQSFLRLTAEEASAINCHMGQWDATQYSNPTAVYDRNLLAWLLHVADEAATFIKIGG